MTLKSQNMLVQTLKGVGNVLAGKGKKDKGSTLCLKQVVTSQNDEEAKTEKAGKRIPAQIAFEKMQAKRVSCQRGKTSRWIMKQSFKDTKTTLRVSTVAWTP
ncbi:protein FAM32A-like isoform X2 [Solea solea]|uniref:protein FAM32A-like isoform X2 n=1 Tax=Solea solea TaxID=90069 RepID=UPI00272CAFEC|nr:protein FAM32A-like isoform X2 [Solea solea]